MSPAESAEYRVLGPLEVLAGSRRLELGGARQQIVLAMLLLSPDRVVSMARLEEALYGAGLPPTSRSQVQTGISSLRRLLTVAGQPPIISRQAQGYVLQLGTGRLDLLRFDELVSAARAARDAGDPGRAVARYRDAQRLWRGPALEGIDSELVRAAAIRLDERRVTIHEDRLALELDLGRHHELVAELDELVAEHPLRERLRGQLMLALYRCGREAEALQVYQRTRRILVDELGIEPGRQLQDLQRAILNGDPALDPPAAPVALTPAPRQVPYMLPPDIADFTGRDAQVSQIREQLTASPGRGPRLAAPVLVVTGTGGVGKTSLAVHAAHALAGQFGDGQLFADLHAGTANPVGPAQVLERFLRALGVPGPQVPESLDERAEAYRSLLASRRMLVVLDDAVTESQVSPLIPDVLDELVSARLVEVTGAPGVHSQYRLHELIRVFAQERLAAEEQAAERAAALERALGTLLYLAGEARHRFSGGSYLPYDSGAPLWPLPGPLTQELISDPVAWYERERAALVSGVHQAAEAGLVELCWSLVLCAETLFEARGYRDDWRETAGVALEATRAAGLPGRTWTGRPGYSRPQATTWASP